MKLARFGKHGSEKPGIFDDNGILRDLSGYCSDIDSKLLSDLSPLANVKMDDLPVVENNPRLGACITGTGKFICIGLNYSDHALETGLPVPTEPVIFMKATSAICGPNDSAILPRGSTKMDWEVELGVVIGKPAKYVSEDQALDHVAGYCLINDYSERYFQDECEGQWTKGKSCDHFGPIGPYLATRDEIANPQKLDMGSMSMESGGRPVIFHDGLWCRASYFIFKPVYVFTTRRYHFNGHTTGSWKRHVASNLFKTRRYCNFRYRGSRQTDASCCC